MANSDMAKRVAVAGAPSMPDTQHLPHDNIGTRFVIIVWMLTGLATIFLGLRIYCKYWRRRGLWWDDYILIVSWMTLVAYCALETAMVPYGFGSHIWDLPPSNNPSSFLLLGLIGATLVICGAAWSKTSFAVTLIRIAEGKTRMFVWFIIWSMNILQGVSALALWIECSPVSKNWDPTVKGSCWPKAVGVNLGIAASAYSGLMDLTLAILPWRVIWSIGIKRREKAGIALAMSMGVFAGGMAFLKSANIYKISAGDITYEVVDLVIWGVAEIATTIMAASIPLLRALVIEAKKGSFIQGQRSYSRPGGESGGLRFQSSFNITVTTVSANRTVASTSSKPVNNTCEGSDSTSAKGILAEAMVAPADGRILRRDEVQIDYTDTRGFDDSGYEMDRVAAFRDRRGDNV